VLGEAHELEQSEMVVQGLNMVKYATIPDGLQAVTKIRYKDPGTESTLFNENGNIRVQFHAAVSSIAPGQSAVIYEGDDVIAGGIIQRGL
jgi:tRNA-specific 2-thiouridylase